MRYDKWIRDWKTALAENFFLRTSLLLLLVGLILNASVFRRKTIVVVSPPQTTKQYWVAEDQASPTYMRQMAVFFSTLAGNISPGNAQYVADTIASYVVSNQYTTVHQDLTSQAEYIKQNNVTQSFYPLATKVDQAANSAAVEGTVQRYVGTTRISDEKMVYHVTFITRNYQTQLSDFYIEYPNHSQHTAAPPPVPKGQLMQAKPVTSGQTQPQKGELQ